MIFCWCHMRCLSSHQHMWTSRFVCPNCATETLNPRERERERERGPREAGRSPCRSLGGGGAPRWAPSVVGQELQVGADLAIPGAGEPETNRALFLFFRAKTGRAFLFWFVGEETGHGRCLFVLCLCLLEGRLCVLECITGMTWVREIPTV